MREAILEAIRNGATIGDIAAANNVSWDQAVRLIHENGIKPPAATQDTAPDRMVAKYLGLTDDQQHPDQVDLVQRPDGPFGLPANFSIQRIDLNQIFERFHGQAGYVDPYTGAPTQNKILIVNASESQTGRPRNFLCTNLETLSEQTIKERFCDWMRPIQETFEFQTLQHTFELTIQRAYDRLVGGTYQQPYMEALWDRWVGQPLAQHLTRGPEHEAVFSFNTPFSVAWWAWDQLTHAGLLKGLVGLNVRDRNTGRTTVLRDDDVHTAIVGFLLKEQKGSSLIVPAAMPGKFAPGKLLGR